MNHTKISRDPTLDVLTILMHLLYIWKSNSFVRKLLLYWFYIEEIKQRPRRIEVQDIETTRNPTGRCRKDVPILLLSCLWSTFWLQKYLLLSLWLYLYKIIYKYIKGSSNPSHFILKSMSGKAGSDILWNCMPWSSIDFE